MSKESLKNKDCWQIIADKTGYNFSGYSAESLNRRLEKFMSGERIGTADELCERFNSDSEIQDKIIRKLLTNYTEMFRDPGFFLSLRKNILPRLSALEKISIWHVGCSTGEEAYSLAIVLDEMNLLQRCNILATDVNPANVKNASEGIYPLQRLTEATKRYRDSGGEAKLPAYYTAYYDHVIMQKFLGENIRFETHDLLRDDPGQLFHLILCRNVFIYFIQPVQRTGVKLLGNYLHNDGFLGLGLNEHFTGSTDCMLLVDEKNKIYRRINSMNNPDKH